MNMTEQELNKWAGYYHYFYFQEDMTFAEFLKRVEGGNVPKRSIVFWDRVRPAYEIHIEPKGVAV